MSLDPELRKYLDRIVSLLDPNEQSPTDPPTRERASAGDSDKALAALIEPLLPCMPDQASSLLSLKIARAAREHLDAESLPVTQDALEREWALHERAEKAESEADRIRHERDDWRAKHAALRADVERMSHNDGPVIANKIAADGARRILDRDDARDPSSAHHRVGSKCQRDYCEGTHEPDADTVTLPRHVARLLTDCWEGESDGGADDKRVTRIARAALGGESDE